MKKRGIMLSLIVFAFLLILSTNIVSAQYGLDDALDFIGGENILLIITFGVSFAILLWVLGKFFKGNKGVPLVISVLLSFGITQAVNMMNFGLEIGTGGFGLSDDVFGLLIGLAALVVFILMIWKAKLHTVWIMGLLIAFLGVIGGVEINYVAIALGVGLILLYALFLRKKEPGESRMPSKGVIFAIIALGVVGAIVWLLYSGGSKAGAGIRIFTNPLAITIMAIALFLLVLFTYAYGRKKRYEKLPKGKLILFSIFGSLIITGIVWMLYAGGVGATPGFDWFATNPLAMLILGIAVFFIFAFILFKTGKKESYWKRLVVLVILTLIGIFIWLAYSGNAMAEVLMGNPIFWISAIVGIILFLFILSKTLRKKTAESYDFEKEKKQWRSKLIFLLLGLVGILLWALGIGVPYTLFGGIGLLALWLLILIFSKKGARTHVGEHKKGYGLALLFILLGLAIAGIGYFWTGLISTGWALIIGGIIFAIGLLLLGKRTKKTTGITLMILLVFAGITITFYFMGIINMAYTITIFLILALIYIYIYNKNKKGFGKDVAEIKRGGGIKKWAFLVLAIIAGILGVLGIGSPIILFIIAGFLLIMFIVLLLFGREKGGKKKKETTSVNDQERKDFDKRQKKSKKQLQEHEKVLEEGRDEKTKRIRELSEFYDPKFS
ncbi:hypothetical protein GF378_01105, partial [Candidatus Pacearchaeota archaeon]|nr:hypothetical protein [Candidatus Pacearchaeota archaeon]